TLRFASAIASRIFTCLPSSSAIAARRAAPSRASFNAPGIFDAISPSGASNACWPNDGCSRITRTGAAGGAASGFLLSISFLSLDGAAGCAAERLEELEARGLRRERVLNQERRRFVHLAGAAGGDLAQGLEVASNGNVRLSLAGVETHDLHA